MSNHPTYKALCATVFGVITAVALAVGCGGNSDTGDADTQLNDERFNKAVTERISTRSTWPR